MKIAFRTIDIEKLVISYSGIFGSFLALHYLFNFTIHAAFFMLLPVVLYFCFRGKIEIAISENRIKISWLNKPLLGTFEHKTIDLSEIIRWKYEHTFRGPDRFTLILESGEKIKICPGMFVVKDVETTLIKGLKENISEANSGIPEDVLLRKIQFSGYVKKLNQKNRRVQLFRSFLLVAGLVLLFLGAFFPDSREIWVSFFIMFCCFFLILIRLYYLKNERKDTLRVE